MSERPSSSSLRAIVGRFSYPFSKETMERVLAKQPFAYCGIISVGREPDFFSAIPEDCQDWFCSSDIRGGRYMHTDRNDMHPLDEELIESMRDCEAVFMEMVHRLEWKRRISHDERKYMYLTHLRFWNDYIERHDINLYLSAWNPHEIPDIIIYHLCKHKGIRTVYFHTSTVRDISFTEHSIEQSAAYLEQAYETLLSNYEGGEVQLSDAMEKRYEALTAPAGEKPPLENLRRATYGQRIRSLIAKHPLKSLGYVLSYCTPSGMTRLANLRARRRVIREREAFYKAHAVEPDYSAQFVYLPLHFQPEASTVPMAGAFADQVMMTQLLSVHLPDDVLIYVKEHYKPSSWLCRTRQTYEDLLALPNVRLVSMDADTFDLREHCSAVATATGSAGFEALFRRKPVFLFGHRYYQYARGVYRIHSADDMQRAVRAVFTEHEVPTPHTSRLFLKAMEEAGIHGVLNPWHLKVSDIPEEEHITANVEAILKELR